MSQVETKKSDKLFATGKRKESVARVQLVSGTGVITVNGMPADRYFSRETELLIIKQPLELTKTIEKLNVIANVNGGGHSGQAGALRHGISRALVLSDIALKSLLRKAGFLTRDPRSKERKKYGLKGARKRFQWTKR
jgi:small subunit ribosomal protein S9